MYPGHYDNWSENQPSALISIPSDIIETSVLSVFIVHRSAYEERFIKPLCDYAARQDSIGQDSLTMDCLSRFYSLKIDDEPVEADFLFTRKRDPPQVGLQGYLDIEHLHKGMHTLELYYDFLEEDGSVRNSRMAKVEFYKVQTDSSSPKPSLPLQPNAGTEAE